MKKNALTFLLLLALVTLFLSACNCLSAGTQVQLSNGEVITVMELPKADTKNVQLYRNSSDNVWHFMKYDKDAILEGKLLDTHQNGNKIYHDTIEYQIGIIIE